MGVKDEKIHELGLTSHCLFLDGYVIQLILYTIS